MSKSKIEVVEIVCENQTNQGEKIMANNPLNIINETTKIEDPKSTKEIETMSEKETKKPVGVLKRAFRFSRFYYGMTMFWSGSKVANHGARQMQAANEKAKDGAIDSKAVISKAREVRNKFLDENSKVAEKQKEVKVAEKQKAKKDENVEAVPAAV